MNIPKSMTMALSTDDTVSVWERQIDLGFLVLTTSQIHNNGYSNRQMKDVGHAVKKAS